MSSYEAVVKALDIMPDEPFDIPAGFTAIDVVKQMRQSHPFGLDRIPGFEAFADAARKAVEELTSEPE